LNVLVLTYWSFPDALVQTYTLPYVRMIRSELPAGSWLYFFTADQLPDAELPPPLQEVRAALEGAGIRHLRGRYSPFGVRAMLRWGFDLIGLWTICITQRVAVIHAFCTPAGVAGYILSLLTGARLIVDSYEPHAEAMVENGTWRPGSLRERVLSMFEARMSARATVLIGTTAAMEEYALRRYGVKPRRFHAKPACVDLDAFRPELRKQPELLDRLGLRGKRVGVYAGKLGGIYLDRELFDFLKQAADHWGDRFRALLLTPTPRVTIERLAAASALDPQTIVSAFIPHAEIPPYIGLGDFAINPVKPVPTKRYCTSIKDGEYWAMGLPVVITPGISEDSDTIARERIGAVLRELTPAGYRDAVLAIDRLLEGEERDDLTRRIRGVAIQLRSPAIAQAVYKAVYATDLGQ
jgi:glycosyltransferase involved in cell wall biosynthesis